MTNPEAPSFVRRVAAPLLFTAAAAAGVMAADAVYQGGEARYEDAVAQGVACGEVLAQYQDRPQLSYGLPDECEPFADAIPEVDDPISGDSYLVLPGRYALQQYATNEAEVDRVNQALLSGLGVTIAAAGLSGLLLSLPDTPAPRASRRKQ